MNNNKNILKSSSFTLIELIIVLAIISILVTILIATIKPTEIFKKARDNKRIADLKNIEKTIDLLYSTYPNFNELNYASTNIVYISLKDDSPTCSSYIFSSERAQKLLKSHLYLG
jgi:prepilin-type N-terminal cleavage/methylation domain-containing protein